MWQQGLEEAPEVVRLCRQSLKNSIDKEIKIIEINDENLEMYIDLPEYILEKYSLGKISRAMFADIVRIRLLATYGGIWLDSTVFVSKKIPEWFFSVPFFSAKDRYSFTYADPANMRWVPFIIGGDRA